MDHYKTLGLGRNATKGEIKEAFRRSALKFHPDKHSQSSKEVREGASLMFKQASEAYEVLIDDRKRADYDRVWRGGYSDRWSRGASSSSYSYSSQYHEGRQYSYRRPPARDGVFGLDLESVFRLLTRRSFLVNMAFARLFFLKLYESFLRRILTKFFMGSEQLTSLEFAVKQCVLDQNHMNQTGLNTWHKITRILILSHKFLRCPFIPLKFAVRVREAKRWPKQRSNS